MAKPFCGGGLGYQHFLLGRVGRIVAPSLRNDSGGIPFELAQSFSNLKSVDNFAHASTLGMVSNMA